MLQVPVTPNNSAQILMSAFEARDKQNQLAAAREMENRRLALLENEANAKLAAQRQLSEAYNVPRRETISTPGISQDTTQSLSGIGIQLDPSLSSKQDMNVEIPLWNQHEAIASKLSLVPGQEKAAEFHYTQSEKLKNASGVNNFVWKAWDDAGGDVNKFKSSLKAMGATDEQLKDIDPSKAGLGYMVSPSLGVAIGRDGKMHNLPKPEKPTEQWSDPYVGNIGGKRVMLKRNLVTNEVKPVVSDTSTTVKIDTSNKSNASNAMKLRKEFNALPEVKEYNQTMPKIKAMESAYATSLKTKNFVAVDQALITLYNKLTDPNSVVRESEYARTAENIPLINQIQGKTEKIKKGGAGLTASERNALIQMARLMQKGYEEIRSQRMNEYHSYGEQIGLDKNYLLDSTKMGTQKTVGRFIIEEE